LLPRHRELLLGDVSPFVRFHKERPFTIENFLKSLEANHPYSHLFAVHNNEIFSVAPHFVVEHIHSVYYLRINNFLRLIHAVAAQRRLPDALLLFNTRDVPFLDQTCFSDLVCATSLPACLKTIRPSQRWRTPIAFDDMRDTVPEVYEMSAEAVVREFERWFPDEARWANASVDLMRKGLFDGVRQEAPSPRCRRTRPPMFAPVLSVAKVPSCHADILIPDEGVFSVLQLVEERNSETPPDVPAWADRADTVSWRGSSQGDCMTSHMHARGFAAPQPLDDDLTKCQNHRIRLSALLQKQNATFGHPLFGRLDVAVSSFLYVHELQRPSLERVVRSGYDDKALANVKFALDIDGFSFSERTPRLQWRTGCAVLRCGIMRSLVETWMVENEHVVNVDPWFAEDLPQVVARLEANGLGERIGRQGQAFVHTHIGNLTYLRCFADAFMHAYAEPGVGINFTDMVADLQLRGQLRRINLFAENITDVFR
jgi:hypothetical protein